MKRGKAYFMGAVVLVFLIFTAISSFAETKYQRGEKLFNDPKLSSSGNEKSCATCHPGGKGVDNKPLSEEALEKAINNCIEKALKGKPLSEQSDFNALKVYISSLQGRRLFSDPKLSSSTNDKSCASCHPEGKDFEDGTKTEDIGDTINSCIKGALKGKELEKTAPTLTALRRYIWSLEKKK